MALTPEGKVKEQIKRLFKQYGVWYFMPVSNGMGKMGVPDFVCCVQGKFFAVEAKRPGGKPTELQKMQMHQIQLAGGRAFLVDGDMELLETWLKEIT